MFTGSGCQQRRMLPNYGIFRKTNKLIKEEGLMIVYVNSR